LSTDSMTSSEQPFFLRNATRSTIVSLISCAGCAIACVVSTRVESPGKARRLLRSCFWLGCEQALGCCVAAGTLANLVHQYLKALTEVH